MSNSSTICRSCGATGNPKSVTPGHFLIEVLLWCCFLVPGLIYSIWRVSKRHKACRSCGSRELVPVDSPIGKKLLAELSVGKG